MPNDAKQQDVVDMRGLLPPPCPKQLDLPAEDLKELPDLPDLKVSDA